MSSDNLNYGQLMHEAMQFLMSRILSDVAEHGLRGDHHFYISFDTNHSDVDIPDWLRERYPESMTIVLQEWFDDLTVQATQFTVTLNFGNVPVPLLIPFDAVQTFVDPSAEFGLRFDEQDDSEDEAEAMHLHPVADEDQPDLQEILNLQDEEDPIEDTPEEQSSGADVVSLDSFRKP